MNKTGLFRAALITTVSTLLLWLAGCEAESDSDRRDDDCPSVGNLSVDRTTPLGANPRCLISGVLTVDATLRSGVDWRLDGAIEIGDGASSPRLTIAAGAELRGSSADEYVYVAPGASINALGTASNPIIFSSADDGYEGPGEWGGLVLEDTLAAFSPNELNYLIVTEAGAGFTMGANTYNDNIVLLGPHDETRVQYLQSHDSARDGLRLEGTDSEPNQARLAWVLITGANRDGLAYEHFTGLVKDLLVLHRPALFDTVDVTGGRAGIYASGSASLPLFANVTLVGRDDTVSASGGDDIREVGVIFAESTSGIRMVNTIIGNFRNGCYEVDDSSDLSAVGTDGSADNNMNMTSYIDGVHCVTEAGTIAGLSASGGLVRVGGVDLDLPGSGGAGNGDGLRYHGNEELTFFGESGAGIPLTSAWHVTNVGGVAGLLNDQTMAQTNLNAYNDGDTNDSGVTNDSDVDYQPLLDNSSGSGFFASVLGTDEDSAGYDLTRIGASRGVFATQADEFDGWTLQDGALDTDITGFYPP